MIVCKECFKGNGPHKEVEFDYYQWFDATEDFYDPHGRYCDVCGREFEEGQIVVCTQEL